MAKFWSPSTKNGATLHHSDREREERRYISNQKIALYNKWLSVCPEAKWSDVISALERTSHILLASKVKQKLGIK